MTLLDDILIRAAVLLTGILCGVQGTLVVQRRRVAALRPFWIGRLHALAAHYSRAWSADALRSHSAELDAMAGSISDVMMVGARPKVIWRELAFTIAELRACVNRSIAMPSGDELVASLAAVRRIAQQLSDQFDAINR